jgi:ParB-like chromosome segregation protein Spo0J
MELQTEITWLPLDKIKPYKHNPKSHPPKQIEQLARQIQALGFLDPIAIDEKFEILEGHGRLLASQLLGLKQVPVIQILGLTRDEKSAYRISHNKLTMDTGWDLENLSIEFESIDKSLIEFTAFNEDEIESILDSISLPSPEQQEKEQERLRKLNLLDDESDDDDEGEAVREIDEKTVVLKNTCPSCGFKW